MNDSPAIPDNGDYPVSIYELKALLALALEGKPATAEYTRLICEEVIRWREAFKQP